MIDGNKKKRIGSPIQLLLVVLISTFTVEMVIMFTLPHLLNISEFTRALMDSTLLVALTFPVIFTFFYRPMALHIRSRDLAEKDLQLALDKMETQVQARTSDLVRINYELESEIIERNRVAQQLKRSEFRLVHILDNAAEAIISVDKDQKILLFNKGAEQIFGYQTEDVIGKPLDILLPQKFIQTHHNLIQSMGEKSFSSRSLQKRGEVAGLRMNGTEFPAQVGFSSHIEEDQVIFTAILVDITERKLAEQALTASEERYRNLFNRIPVGLYRTSPDGKILEANPALVELLGYHDLRTFLQTNVSEIYVNREDRVRENIILEKDGIVRGFQYQVQRFDGPRIWVRDTSLLIRNEDGTRLCYEGSLEDITNQIQAEELIRSNAMRNSLLAEISRVIAEVGLEYNAILDVVRKRVSEWIGDPCFITLFDGNDRQLELDHCIPESMVLPLRVQGRTIGVMEMRCDKTKPSYHSDDYAILQDIAHHAALAIANAQLFEEAQRNLHKVQALHRIDTAIAESLDLHHIFSTLLDQAISQLGVDAANILLLSPNTWTLDYTACKGFRTNSLQYTHLRLGEGYAGKAAFEKHSIHIPDLRKQGTDLLRSPTFLMEEFVSYFAVPLIANGHVRGVLEIFQRSLLEPDQDWIQFLETLAKQATIAIENAQLFEDLERSNHELFMAYDATIEGWSHALDLRDKETEGHSQRVTEMSVRLSRVMGIPDAELVQVRRGALLHDIGKMGIPDRILLKPEPLTDEEWLIMQKHPTYAYELLAPITYLKSALDIPYCHHEKWDGTGYPRGLKGEQIPLVARIFVVVDVWDALSSDRPYRPAWTSEKVQQYIREQSGKHFDPCVVEAFLKMM